MSLLLLVFLGGCMEYRLAGRQQDDDHGLALPGDDTGAADESDAGGSDGGGSNGGSDDGGSGGGGSNGGGSGGNSGDGGSSGSGGSSGDGGGSGDGGSDEEPGDSASNPRSPAPGELVLSELMIDPDAVADADGEYVEIWNGSGDWLDLSGYRLADEGVDDVELQPATSDGLVVEPDGYLVACANADYWDNGGIDCDATFVYQTWGGGFALSNTEDEVLLLDPSGAVVDRFAWDEGFTVVGAGMGVDPDSLSTSANDDPDDWCDQWSYLPFGDSGSPGEDNDWCW